MKACAQSDGFEVISMAPKTVAVKPHLSLLVTEAEGMVAKKRALICSISINTRSLQ